MKQQCQYSQFEKNGLEQSLICSLTNKLCIKQRYCNQERRLVNTDDWHTCAQLKKEEEQNVKQEIHQS